MEDGLDSAGFHTARNIWAACIAILLGPALMAWIVRLVALGAHCAPGPEACHGMVLGGGLHDALALTWLINSNTLLLLGVSAVATAACLVMRWPLMSALTFLLLPLAALIVPMTVVYSSLYSGCAVSETGLGSCPLWGTDMGMSFHTAAEMQWQIYGFVPYTFAIALMLGVMGFFLVRPREINGHAVANPRRFPDDRFESDQ